MAFLSCSVYLYKNVFEKLRICTNSVISQELNTKVALLDFDVAGKDALVLYILAPTYFILTVCPGREALRSFAKLC